jgi:hypothetical protein
MFARPFFSNGCCIFAYLEAVAQQRVYMSQYVLLNLTEKNSRDNSVSIAMGYVLDGAGWIPSRGKRFFFPAQCPYRPWCSQRHSYPKGTMGTFFESKAEKGVTLTTVLHLVPLSRMMELYLHSLLRLHCVVLNN